MQVLFFAATARHALEAGEARHAMHSVHHDVAELEFEEALQSAHTVRGSALRAAALAQHSHQLAVVDDQELGLRQAEALGDASQARLDAAGALLVKDSAEACPFRFTAACDQHARAVLLRLQQRCGRVLDAHGQ